jgi:acetoin utilization deacetylase AcuC-like enzyme
MERNVQIIYHKNYLTEYQTASCECADRVSAVISELSHYYDIVAPEPCSEEDILRCHSLGLLTVEKHDTRRYETARLAAGGAILAAKLAMNDVLAFAAIRPPGHHANPDHNWGFCFFNNMAIALSWLLAESMITRALVLDIDLHYGDGTEAVFSSNPSVSVRNIQSSRRDEFLSETRAVLDETGETAIIGISAGFAQYIKDWGANLTTEDYFTIGEYAGAYARNKSKGKIFMLLEGGYYIPDLGKNAHALIEGARRRLGPGA